MKIRQKLSPLKIPLFIITNEVITWDINKLAYLDFTFKITVNGTVSNLGYISIVNNSNGNFSLLIHADSG